MKSSLVQVILAAFAIVQVSSSVLPPGVLPGGVDPAKDLAKFQACQAGDSDTIWGASNYGQGAPFTIAYGQCLPFVKNDEPLGNLVICRPITCQIYSGGDCTTPSLPVPLTITGPILVPYPLQFELLTGQSVKCWRNGIPSLL